MRYPWHPFFGKDMPIKGSIVRDGRLYHRCRLPARCSRESIELPAWMFDEAFCESLFSASIPQVSLEALAALTDLLSGIPSCVRILGGKESANTEGDRHADENADATPGESVSGNRAKRAARGSSGGGSRADSGAGVPPSGKGRASAGKKRRAVR